MEDVFPVQLDLSCKYAAAVVVSLLKELAPVAKLWQKSRVPPPVANGHDSVQTCR